MSSWQSWRLPKAGSPLRLVTDVADVSKLPSPLVNAEVLVHILYTGVCHSDEHIAQGFFDQGDGKKTILPDKLIVNRTLGHEPMGVVVAVGPQANNVKKGDKVAVYPWMGCGKCRFCLKGDEQLCMVPQALGLYVDGGFSTHLRVSHEKYCVSVGSADPRFACICACSGLTAYGAIGKWGPVANDANVLICGAGGLGFMALCIFKALYPNHPGPILMDVADEKLKAAKAAGLCQDTINPKTDEEKLKKIQVQSGILKGIDFAADFVGAGSTVDTLYRLMNKGGHLVIAGLFGGNFKISPAILPLRSLTISGTYVGTLHQFKELIEMVKAHKLQTPPIDNRSFADLPKAMEDLVQGKVLGRIVLSTQPQPSL